MANQFHKDPDTSNAVYKAIGISLHRKYFYCDSLEIHNEKTFK